MLAAEDAPPKDELPLIAFGDGDLTHASALKEQAKSPEHIRSHFPKNPFCKVCSISKTTSARAVHKKDARSDDKVNIPTAPFQQLATDSVILAMGDEYLGIGFGGIKSHHVVRDVFSSVCLAYPVSRRDTQANVKKSVSSWAFGPLEVGLTPETSLPNRWPRNTMTSMKRRMLPANRIRGARQSQTVPSRQSRTAIPPIAHCQRRESHPNPLMESSLVTSGRVWSNLVEFGAVWSGWSSLHEFGPMC